MVVVSRRTDFLGSTTAFLLTTGLIVGSSIGEDSRGEMLASGAEVKGADTTPVGTVTAIVLSATRGTMVSEGAVDDSLERLVDPRTGIGGAELFLGMLKDCTLVVA